MPPKKTAGKRTMTAAHKAAIAEGRVQNKAVSEYLSALEASKGKRGRKRTPESITARLKAIDAALPQATGVTRLNLHQEQENLKRELASKQQKVDVSAFEKAFVTHARAYGERKGISYGVWRKAGVPAEVLKRAGISRGA